MNDVVRRRAAEVHVVEQSTESLANPGYTSILLHNVRAIAVRQYCPHSVNEILVVVDLAAPGSTRVVRQQGADNTTEVRVGHGTSFALRAAVGAVCVVVHFTVGNVLFSGLNTPFSDRSFVPYSSQTQYIYCLSAEVLQAVLCKAFLEVRKAVQREAVACEHKTWTIVSEVSMAKYSTCRAYLPHRLWQK